MTNNQVDVQPKTQRAGQRQHRKPRVVMTVFNTFEHDTRVYKEARSLIQWGCEVHVVCIHKGELPREAEQDGILIHRVSPSPVALLRLLLFVLYLPSILLLKRLMSSPPPSARDATKKTGRIQRFLYKVKRAVSAFFRGLRRIASRQRNKGWPFWLPRWLRSIVYYGLYRPVVRGRRSFRLTLRAFKLWRYHHHLTIRHSSIFLRRVVLWFFHPAIVINLAGLDLARCVIGLEPDLMVSHDLSTLTAGVIVKRVCAVPLVYDSHELYLERNIGDKNRSVDRFLWGFVERRCMGHVDLGMSVAQGICDWIAARYKHDNVRLIRNVQPYEPPVPRSTEWQRELAIPEGKKIGIYAGAITINRGLEQLIDAAPHLKQMVFVVMGYAGRAAYLEALLARAEQNGSLNKTVFFKDAVPMDQVISVVASAAVSVVPTQNACLSYFFEASNKIFHSLMAGVPVAMSDHAEKAAIVHKHHVGVLFDETDPAVIAEVTEAFVLDDERLLQASKNCLIAAKELNWDHEEHRLRTYFKPLLGDRIGPVPPLYIAALEEGRCD